MVTCGFEVSQITDRTQENSVYIVWNQKSTMSFINAQNLFYLFAVIYIYFYYATYYLS